MSQLVLHGDISKLNPAQKVEYYVALCQRVGLDPATQPFRILKMQGKEVVYCDRGGAAQLNQLHKVSHDIVMRENVAGCYVVTAVATLPTGRHETSIGAVPIDNLKGEALCNAMMKCETKAKRRSTLDLLGLGMLDESEVGSIPDAQPMLFNQETGTTKALPQPITISETPKQQPLPTDKVPKKAVDDRVRDFLANANEAGHMKVWAFCVLAGRLPKNTPLETINPAAIPYWGDVAADLALNDTVSAELQAQYESIYDKESLPGLEHPSDRTAKEELAPKPDDGGAAYGKHEWGPLLAPFGKSGVAGTRLDAVSVKMLWFFVVKWAGEPLTAREFKGKTYEPKENEKAVWAVLNKWRSQIMAHYSFEDKT